MDASIPAVLVAKAGVDVLDRDDVMALVAPPRVMVVTRLPSQPRTVVLPLI
jgi:hypothetical protein